MGDSTNLIGRYVAVWNESDPDARRRGIRSLWSPSGTTCYRLLDARGYEAIEARVAGSWDRWLSEGKHLFRPVRTTSHHNAIKLDFAMVTVGDDNIAAHGLCYLLLDDDGRIAHDYQFNPSAHEAVELAEKYLAPWNEPDAGLRRKGIAELWAEKGAWFGDNEEARGHAELAEKANEGHGALVDKGPVVSADKSQHHHHVAHVAWRILSNDGSVAGTSSALLVFEQGGRISIAYQFDERTEPQ